MSTAKEGETLRVLGEPSKPMFLKTCKSDTKYHFLPIVVEGLSMDVNISGPWMKKNGWDQIHSQDCVRIQGRDVPLCKKSAVESHESFLYVVQEVVATANAMTLVQLEAPEVSTGRMPHGNGIVQGDGNFMDNTDLHPGVFNLCRADRKGRVTAAVLNTQPYDIVIPKGQRYGTFTKTCDPRDWSKTPWRICAVTQKSKKEEDRQAYLKRFIQASKDSHHKLQKGEATMTLTTLD